MQRLKTLLLRLCCFPADLVVSLGAYLVVRGLWGTAGVKKSRGASWAIVSRLKPTSWPAQTWYRGWGGTTFGHFVMVNSTVDEDRLDSLLMHEFVHVEQFEVGCVFGAVVMIASPLLFPFFGYWFPFFMWAVSSPLFAACAYVTAWLRGESAYEGSSNEEAAYDAVAVYESRRRGKA